MFGMRHSWITVSWKVGRRPRLAGALPLRLGRGRHGGGGGDMMRAGRMLAQGDLRLIALALIAEQPRHGYEIIKVLEDKTEGWYSPSPGIVYPTLTYLEEAGYVTAQTEGAKKLYTITEEGRAHLADNRDFVEAVLERLAASARRSRACVAAPAEDDESPTAFRRWSGPRWKICARSRPSSSKATPKRKQRWSRCSHAPRRN